MKALLLAAGLGTRLKPFTDSNPKALATVNGITLLERNIKKLQAFGINEFVINVHHFADKIINFLEEHDGFGSRYKISHEQETALETGGGLVKAKELLEPFTDTLVMNVDILSNINLKNFIQYHLIHNPLATLAVQDRESSRKLLFIKNNNDEHQLAGWKNTTTNELKINESYQESEVNQYAFSGIQIISSQLLDHITEAGKFSIIDVYLRLMAQQRILAYDHTGDILLDVGKPEAISEAERLFS